MSKVVVMIMALCCIKADEVRDLLHVKTRSITQLTDGPLCVSDFSNLKARLVPKVSRKMRVQSWFDAASKLAKVFPPPHLVLGKLDTLFFSISSWLGQEDGTKDEDVGTNVILTQNSSLACQAVRLLERD